ATLAAAFNMSPAEVRAVVSRSCVVFYAASRCVNCGKPYVLRSREDLRHGVWRYRKQPCDQCQESERLEAQRAGEEQRRLRYAAIKADITERQASAWWGDPRLLSFEDAVFLLAVFRAGGSEDLLYVAPQSDFALPLSPTTTFDRRILLQLYQRGILAVHPGSKPDSILGNTAEPFASFFTLKVHWLLPVPATGPSTARYLEDLETLLKSPADWPDDWAADAPELHRVIAFEECLEYLRLSLEEHGFESQPGEKLSLVMRSVLRQFSIAQVYNFIWRAARDAAAFYVRERTSKTHARNIVPGSIQRMAERAVAEKWAVKPYRRDRRAPESQVSHVLFTMALQLPEGGFNTVPPPAPPEE